MGTCSKPSFKQSAFKKKGNQDFYGKKNIGPGISISVTLINMSLLVAFIMLHLKKTQNKPSSILIVNLMILSTNFEADRT